MSFLNQHDAMALIQVSWSAWSLSVSSCWTQNGYNALLAAAAGGSVDVLERLLSLGMNIHHADKVRCFMLLLLCFANAQLRRLAKYFMNFRLTVPVTVSWANVLLLLYFAIVGNGTRTQCIFSNI